MHGKKSRRGFANSRCIFTKLVDAGIVSIAHARKTLFEFKVVLRYYIVIVVAGKNVGFGGDGKVARKEQKLHGTERKSLDAVSAKSGTHGISCVI